MALGRRAREQQDFGVSSFDLPKSPGHPFCSKLSQLFDEADTKTLMETLVSAQANTALASSSTQIKNAVADKGYHSTDNVVLCEAWGVRSYIPERENRWQRKWSDKPVAHKHAAYGNRRRVKGGRGKRLSRLRSEYVERSFAHVCETGGARRNWLRGLEDVTKRYLMYVAGKNLGVIMRTLFGMGKPRTLQTGGGGDSSTIWTGIATVFGMLRPMGDRWTHRIGWAKIAVKKSESATAARFRVTFLP